MLLSSFLETSRKYTVPLLFRPSVPRQPSMPLGGVTRCSAEVRAQCCWRGHYAANRKQTGRQQNLSTYRQQLSWENQGEDERKTPQSTVSPCVLCTSPFCLNIAAGPDWLIASLIRFSRAFFKGLWVSLGFCSSGFVLLVPRFKLCKAIQKKFAVTLPQQRCSTFSSQKQNRQYYIVSCTRQNLFLLFVLEKCFCQMSLSPDAWFIQKAFHCRLCSCDANWSLELLSTKSSQHTTSII